MIPWPQEPKCAQIRLDNISNLSLLDGSTDALRCGVVRGLWVGDLPRSRAVSEPRRFYRRCREVGVQRPQRGEIAHGVWNMWWSKRSAMLHGESNTAVDSANKNS